MLVADLVTLTTPQTRCCLPRMAPAQLRDGCPHVVHFVVRRYYSDQVLIG